MINTKYQPLLLSLFVLGMSIFIGEMLTSKSIKSNKELTEYEMLMGKNEEKVGLPGPISVLKHGFEELSNPFYDNGPNDKGIGIQLGYSVLRVFVGYTLAILIAVPFGFLIGMSPLFYKAFQPYIQILKPISPLAWMPLALFVIKDSVLSSVFVIFICSLWPIVINTAFGVASVKRDWLNVARTLEYNKFETAVKVILPAALPTIFTGLRISIGISWLVIVAAEMLVGGTGVGYYVWNEWNNLDLESVIFSILMIGIVGMLLDYLIAKIATFFTYAE